MSRRAQAPVRHILPDPKFNNDMLAKFMNVVMKSGKKSAAERIIYGAINRIVESPASRLAMPSPCCRPRSTT
jgi:small subunit ribosomal protein S7